VQGERGGKVCPFKDSLGTGGTKIRGGGGAGGMLTSGEGGGGENIREGGEN
jgi:hypothetical protein